MFSGMVGASQIFQKRRQWHHTIKLSDHLQLASLKTSKGVTIPGNYCGLPPFLFLRLRTIYNSDCCWGFFLPILNFSFKIGLFCWQFIPNCQLTAPQLTLFYQSPWYKQWQLYQPYFCCEPESGSVNCDVKKVDWENEGKDGNDLKKTFWGTFIGWEEWSSGEGMARDSLSLATLPMPLESVL